MSNNYVKPDNVTITIASIVYTTKINNFNETGGDIDKTSLPTMSRKYRYGKSLKNPYEVSFDFVTQDTSFGSTLSVGSYVSSAIYSGSAAPGITFTYGVGRINSVNFVHSADDVLRGSMSIEFLPYNVLGSDNRVIT